MISRKPYTTEKAAYYGEKYHMLFDDIPVEYADMYEDIDIIVHKYEALKCSKIQRVDLMLYSLMYRNVNIDFCSVIDMMFFLSKQSEITGYRNTIYSNKAYSKERIVRYYFEYGALFEMYYSKILGIEIERPCRRNEIGPRTNGEAIVALSRKMKAKDIDHVPGINDLPVRTCIDLLANVNKLETSIHDDEYFVDNIKIYADFVDFVKEIVLPYFGGPHRIYEECFLKYSEVYCNKTPLHCIPFEKEKSLLCWYAYINENKYKGPIKPDLVEHYDNMVVGVAEEWLKDSKNVWKHMYEHQDCLQNMISTFYKQKYISLRKIENTSIEEKVFCTFRGKIEELVRSYSRLDSRLERILNKPKEECYYLVSARCWANYVKSIFAEKEEKERIIREEELRRRREAEEKRLEPYRFNIRNKHWRDQNVTFREMDHIYIVDGTPLDSVTTFVKNCFPEFDFKFHAKRKAEASGCTIEEIIEMWDRKARESREQGTVMHEKIESYYLGKSVSTDETFELFKIFVDKILLKPYRTEWAVYDWEQKIAGTIDFVDYQNGEYIIYDWKRSDKLIAKNGLPIKSNPYGVKALPPIDNIDDSPYYHYALQLSLYKYILEKSYNITVSKLRLGIFHPSYNKPYILEMPYLKNEIDTLFRLRSEVVF